jgi:anaerobic selenocysteine-containing dehydrogenase
MAHWVKTVCARDCYDTCAMQAQISDEGRIISVRGEKEDALTQGFVCPRGRKDPERVYTNRVADPYVRSGPKPGHDFESTDWETALDRVTGQLKRVLDHHGPEKVLYLSYAGNVGLLVEKFPQRLWRTLGVTLTDGAICSTSGKKAIALHFGACFGLQPQWIDDEKAIVFWGCNPIVSMPHIWNKARQAAKRNNAPIAVIDPRCSESAQKADLWIRPKPGCDVILAKAIAHQLISSQKYDAEFVARWTTGFDPFKEDVARWPLEKAADASGLAPDTIVELSKWYQPEKACASVIGIGFQKSLTGGEAVRSIALLAPLSGRHRGFFYSSGGGFRINKGYLSGAAFDVPAHKTVSQVTLGEQLARGDFKFVYVAGTNPALCYPDQGAIRRGLCRPDLFVVTHDPHWNETADYADIVLPAQTFFEKEDVIAPWSHWRIQKSNAVIRTVGQSRHEIEVMLGLAKRLNRNESWLYEKPWDAVTFALKDALSPDTDLNDLMAGEPGRLAYPPLNHYPTSTGKLSFTALKTDNRAVTSLPDEIKIKGQSDYYLLLGSSHPHYTHSQFQDVYGPIPATVAMHPEDAHSLGIVEGDTVSLTNALGCLTVTARLTDAQLKGTLWVPKQFPGTDGDPHNLVCPGIAQKLGGGATFNTTWVQLSK